MYGEITPSFREWIIDRTGGQTMLYLICSTISRVDHACYEVTYAQELGVITIDIHVYFIWISVGEGYSHDSKANAFISS